MVLVKTRRSRLVWVGGTLTTGIVIALIGALFWRPLAVGAAAPGPPQPPTTDHPHIANAHNTYSDALVAKKLQQLHKKVPLTIEGAYVSSKSWPVVFVHGFNSKADIDCKASYWGGAINYLHNTDRWGGPLVTVGYYSGDHDCDASLSNYAQFCANVNPGNQGSTNEDLRHVACELAWYIWYTYTQYGTNVQLVGHSMGGLIIRQALYDTPINIYLPPYIGVQDTVTMATPHGGIPIIGASIFICGGCLQANEMRTNNSFWTTLNSQGQNPQGAGWGTDWTMMGSSCESFYNIFDPGVSWQSSLDMSGGHKTEYLNPPCYDHGAYLTDTSTADSAHANWCDYCNADVVSNSSSAWPRSLHNMALALEYSDW